jgi:CRISPR-associated exonuclease Cas4
MADADGKATAAGWREDDLVLISALEHWSYCPRQCALIHLEQTYDENLFTLRGNRAHRTAHDEGG